MVPLFIIWFGIGEWSADSLTLAFGVFFPTVIATAGGVDNVPRSLIRMAQSFGLSHCGDRAQGGAAGRAASDPQWLPRHLVDRDRAAGRRRDDRRGTRHRRFVLSAGNLYDTDNLLAASSCLSLLGLAVSWLIGRAERLLLGR